jgi:hypothetical protein
MSQEMIRELRRNLQTLSYTLPQHPIQPRQVRKILFISLLQVGNDEYLTNSHTHITHLLHPNSPCDEQSWVQVKWLKVSPT